MKGKNIQIEPVVSIKKRPAIYMEVFLFLQLKEEGRAHDFEEGGEGRQRGFLEENDG